jgi:autotransporter family porin
MVNHSRKRGTVVAPAMPARPERQRLKQALLVGASGLALAMLPRGAAALNECGAANAGDTVTCTPAGNVFQDGIDYKVTDLTIVIDNGVIIDTSFSVAGGRGLTSGGNGNYGDLTIKAGTASGSGITIRTDDNFATGIYAQTLDGTIKIDAHADITTLNSNSHGIVADGFTAVYVSSEGNISTSGFASQGIEAKAAGGVVVTSIGDIETSGTTAFGIVANSDGAATTVASKGDITATGSGSGGIFASSDVFTVTVTSTGDISSDSAAIQAYSGGDSVTVTSTGELATGGDDADGIFGKSKTAGVVITSTGNITTQGYDSDGIAALGYNSAKAYVTGDIATQGKLATGVLASTVSGKAIISFDGNVSTEGSLAGGVNALGISGATVTVNGTVHTKGINSVGVLASGLSGLASITSTADVTVEGDGSDAISGSVLVGDVTISSTGDLETFGDQGNGINASGSGTADVVSIGKITTHGEEAHGIASLTKNATVTINSTGDIATEGKNSNGIYVYTNNGSVTITTAGDISTKGVSADGISAESKDKGVQITSTGDISTIGDDARGIYGHSDTATTIVISKGDIHTTGPSAEGIAASGLLGAGIQSIGDVSTTDDGGVGLQAMSVGGAAAIFSTGDVSTKGVLADAILAAGKGDVVARSVGTITTLGTNSSGIDATSISGFVQVENKGAISTAGDQALGIYAASFGASSVTSNGNISVSGVDAHGIVSTSGNAGSAVESTGNITTKDGGTFGILANGATTAQVTAQGAITVAGNVSSGIFATGTSGDVTVTQGGSIAARGNGSHGIFAISGAGAVVLDVSGAIEGGGGSGEGLFISAANASTVHINAGGTVGALSDVAIEDSAEKLVVTNKGSITGTLQLGGGDDALANYSPTTWNLRNFADTDGDGLRDTEGVAISDFGVGSDTVINIGTLRLSTVPISGPMTIDTTGQITHPGGGSADIVEEGIEQGHLVNLELFINSGAITLADGVAGDLLAITDAASVGGGGSGIFRSNGGSLVLDVVLDDGSSQQSDMLVLDNATTGAGGATHIVVAGLGEGAQTTGDGIQVVNVDGASSDNAFVMGGPAVAGAYQYDLRFQNLAKTDQNWYLQSSFFEGSLEYPALVSGALTTWYTDLGALHERLGERRRAVEDPQSAALPDMSADYADASGVRVPEAGQGGWFRVVGADLNIEQDQVADFDLNTTRAEAGFDVGLSDLLAGDDWLVLGGFGGYGWSSVGFDSGADVDFNIATIGAYATYFRGPFYLDALVKVDWLDGDYNSEAVSADGDVELPVFGFSLESGYRFDLTPDGFYLQPQAQLAFAHVGDDSFKDDAGSTITLESADSLRGRLGARIGQELTSDSGGARGNFYLEASVNQEFLGDTEAHASGLRLEQELPGTSFEVGGGVDIALPAEGVSFTFDADYTFGDEVEGIGATGGLRINW